MTFRYLHFGFNFAAAPLTTELEPTFRSFALDWIRYAPNCWVAHTGFTAAEWYALLQERLGTEDTVLIFEINPSRDARFGRAHTWVWEWLDRYRVVGHIPDKR